MGEGLAKLITCSDVPGHWVSGHAEEWHIHRKIVSEWVRCQ